AFVGKPLGGSMGPKPARGTAQTTGAGGAGGAFAASARGAAPWVRRIARQHADIWILAFIDVSFRTRNARVASEPPGPRLPNYKSKTRARLHVAWIHTTSAGA